MEINLKQLKKDLIKIYETYLKDPNNRKMHEKAKKIRYLYFNADQIFNETMQQAIDLLVDVYLELERPGESSKETVKALLKKLKTKSSTKK